MIRGKYRFDGPAPACGRGEAAELRLTQNVIVKAKPVRRSHKTIDLGDFFRRNSASWRYAGHDTGGCDPGNIQFCYDDETGRLQSWQDYEKRLFLEAE
jgi:hypothetical protein